MNWVRIGSDNGLSPIRRQAIIQCNAGLTSIEPLETKCNEILIRIQTFSFTKMHLTLSSAKCRRLCPGGDELMTGLLLYYRKISFGQYSHRALQDHCRAPCKTSKWLGNCVVISKQDLARFEFKMSFGLISYIAREPCVACYSCMTVDPVGDIHTPIHYYRIKANIWQGTGQVRISWMGY